MNDLRQNHSNRHRRFKPPQLEALWDSSDVEIIRGTPYDDRIDVADIFGKSFDDPIAHRAVGGQGDDELSGYKHDYLSGGSGDDTLITHGGGTVEGGPDADTFRFFGEIEEATIKDFNPNEGDVIELSSVGFAGVTKADVRNMLDGGTGGVLDLGLLGVIGRDHGTITLEGVQVSDLSVDDFIIG